MRLQFTSYKSIFEHLLFFISAYVIFVYGFGVFKKVATYPLLAIIIIVILFAYWFRDYKISIDDEKIELFSIYRKRRVLSWSDIEKFHIEKISNNLDGVFLVLHIYTRNKKYSYKVEDFNHKEDFLKALINKCAQHHIPILDLTVEDISKALANIRYEYFVKQVVNNGIVWGLYDNNWVTIIDVNGNKSVLLWPKKKFAREFVKDEWASYSPKSIGYVDLMDKWLPQLKKKGYKVSVFYNGVDSTVVDVETVMHDLRRES